MHTNNLTIVTAGTKMRHYSHDAAFTICGKDVATVHPDQRDLVEADNYYDDDLQDFRVNVTYLRCQEHLPREAGQLLESTNTTNYRTRVERGTIVPVK